MNERFLDILRVMYLYDAHSYTDIYKNVASTHISDSLLKLAEMGLIIKVQKGIYELTDKGERVAEIATQIMLMMDIINKIVKEH
ncbi:MAG: hypothetical protein N2V78_09055 [Methanophagales archaeon]|nr:hypothetical protein [Methanophagales archaeon]